MMPRFATPKLPPDAWQTIRQAILAWIESLRAIDVPGQRLPVIAFLVAVGLVIGPVVALALSWSAFTYASPITSAQRQPQATPEPTSTVAPTVIAVLAPLAASQVSNATPLPAPQASPTATSQSPATSTSTPTSLPLVSADAADWAALQPRLDSAWAADTDTAINILDDFLTRYPDYQPARDKLYAALVISADGLAERGAPLDASTRLTRAVALAPDRTEARVALEALTPTPVIQPQSPQVAGVQVRAAEPVATPVRAQPPAPARAPAPRPVVNPAPQSPPATPTKVPFRPPGGP